MKVQVAHYELSGSFILMALVESNFTLPGNGNKLIGEIEKHHPAQGIMLISIETNGFRAYSFFESHRILALMQLDNLTFSELDLARPSPEPELPF